MKKAIKRIQNSKGFVSIEFLLVAGVIILLASTILYYFSVQANKMSGSAVTQLEAANEAMNP